MDSVFAFVALKPCGCVAQACTPHVLKETLREKWFAEQMAEGKIISVKDREAWLALPWKCDKCKSRGDTRLAMTISIEGVLGRAAEQCKRSRDNKHLEWPLLELCKHLDEMYRRRAEPGILEEFFKVWSAPSS